MLTRSTIQPRWSLWALPVLFALAATAPLMIDPGFLNTRQAGDSPFLLFRLHQLVAALGDGVFPVRWMPDGAFGLGYPFFNYYAALPYYLAALLHALGASYVLSLKLTVVAGAIAASGGMFGWMRAITGRRSAALLAAGAYTFAPYHLVNVYLRGDSLASLGDELVPGHSVGAGSRRRAYRRQLAAVGLAYGALVLTHNIRRCCSRRCRAVRWRVCGRATSRCPRTSCPTRRVVRARRAAGTGGRWLALAAGSAPALRSDAVQPTRPAAISSMAGTSAAISCGGPRTRPARGPTRSGLPRQSGSRSARAR